MQPSPPDRAGAIAEKAHYHLFSGRVELALQMIDEGLVRYPDDPRLHASRARALSTIGDGEAAIASARRAVDLAPDDPRFGEILAEVDHG